MPCSIAINLVTGSISGPNTNINISGTVSGCAANVVVVTVTCGANTYTQNVNVPGGQTSWNTTVVSQCACGSPVSVTAACPPSGCSTLPFNVPNLPCCCPTLTVTTTESVVCVTNLQFCPNGGRQVTFHVSGTLPAGCSSANIQINYGDNFVSQIHTVTSSSFTFTDNHVYCAGPPAYNALIYATTPVGCPGVPFLVNVTACSPCYTTSWIKLLCQALEFTFLVLAAVAATCFIVPTCAGAAFLGIISVLLGIIVYAIYSTNTTLFCLNCSCFSYLKWIGIATLASGLCLIAFITDACVPQLPVWIPPVLIAAGALIILIWYFIYRKLCPLTICHFWLAIRTSGIVALAALTILFASLSAVMVVLWLVISAIAIGVVITIGNQLLNSNQTAGNCVNYP
ncbi:hypothetical protein BH11PAT1_BH11PAT1_7380 [soil metagenome]